MKLKQNKTVDGRLKRSPDRRQFYFSFISPCATGLRLVSSLFATKCSAPVDNLMLSRYVRPSYCLSRIGIVTTDNCEQTE